MAEPVNCRFCSPSESEAWASNQYGIALRAPWPIAPGHTVIAPQRHVASVYDLDVEEQWGLWMLVSEVRRYSLLVMEMASIAIGFEDCLDGHTCIHVVPVGPEVDLPVGITWVKE